jgi:hypothetical protein
VAGMVPHPGVPLDDGGHTRQRPQVGAEAVGACALAEPALYLCELAAVQFGLAAGSTGGAQCGQAAPLPGLVPATGTLPAGVEGPSHKSQSLAGAEQLRGLQAALFQSLEISAWTQHCVHAPTIHQARGIVTILCEIQ